jgi:hypothetical protein
MFSRIYLTNFIFGTVKYFSFKKTDHANDFDLKYTLRVPRSGTCSAPDIKAGAC